MSSIKHKAAHGHQFNLIYLSLFWGLTAGFAPIFITEYLGYVHVSNFAYNLNHLGSDQIYYLHFSEAI